MTDLRTAAQQALEALMDAQRHNYALKHKETDDLITALKAALVEDAMQKFTDVNQELEAALGCDRCNSPLYAAVKCRVCGRDTPIIEPEIKGDNKPVAWIHTDPDKRRVKFLEWRENEPGYRGDWIKTPLYAVPPQRKPLTEEEIDSIWDSEKAFANIYAIARAIERAHGIGGDE